MKKYWLVLFPDTFLWTRNGNGIIYNSQNFKHFTFYCSDDVKKLCDTLVDLDSLYSVEITEQLLNDMLVKQWVDQIITNEAGCLNEQNGINRKLISYYPIVRIQNDFNYMIWEHHQNMGGKIIENLHELVFYINGSLHGSDQYFRQTYYPVSSNKSVDFKHILSFINRCKNQNLNQITFIGDINNYIYLEQLQKWIVSNDYFVRFVLLAEDVNEKIGKFEWFDSEKIEVIIIVSDHSEFSKNIENYKNLPYNMTFSFIVTSKNQFDSISTLIEETNLCNPKIIPIYDGKNIKFFEENIYMTEDEFSDIKLSRRQVFVNMTLNIYSFGKLIIMPDGKIYSNVISSPLGSIEDPIYDLIYREMSEGKMWFRVRDMKPCCDCVYNWLCPTPSNYELAIGKPNLCHISV